MARVLAIVVGVFLFGCGPKPPPAAPVIEVAPVAAEVARPESSPAPVTLPRADEWWTEESPCPEGSTLQQQTDEKGRSVACHLADGELHGRLSRFTKRRRPPREEWRTDEIYVDGSRSGRFHEFRPDGTLVRMGEYVDGVLDGKVTSFGPNGERCGSEEWRAGMKHGRWVFADQSCDVTRVVVYDDPPLPPVTISRIEAEVGDDHTQLTYRTFDAEGNVTATETIEDPNQLQLDHPPSWADDRIALPPGAAIDFTGPKEAALTAAAVALVDDVARLVRSEPNRTVRVEVFVAASGDLEDDQRLATARSAAIIDRLVSRGVAITQVYREPVGSGLPAVEPPSDPRNNRVDLILIDG